MCCFPQRSSSSVLSLTAWRRKSSMMGFSYVTCSLLCLAELVGGLYGFCPEYLLVSSSQQSCWRLRSYFAHLNAFLLTFLLLSNLSKKLPNGYSDLLQVDGQQYGTACRPYARYRRKVSCYNHGLPILEPFDVVIGLLMTVLGNPAFDFAFQAHLEIADFIFY